MEKSQSLKNIAAALVLFHVKVESVKKDANNPFFKSKYASLSNILDVVNDPLNESGLTFCQFPTDTNGLTTILMHSETGEYIQATYEMTPTKNDPQGRGSAITYQRRYALAAILGLNIDEDDDGNAASTPPANKTSQNVISSNNDDNKAWLNKTTADKITSNTTSTNLSFKAKAQDLVDKMYFSRKYKEGEDYVPSQVWAHAKQCAFIAVEEILSMSIMNEYGMEFTKQYWEKIRRELIILIGTDEKEKHN
jgi:hypothetical protein